MKQTSVYNVIIMIQFNSLRAYIHPGSYETRHFEINLIETNMTVLCSSQTLFSYNSTTTDTRINCL